MITELERQSRAMTIGSSDAAAILGLNPYQNAYGVWAEKRGMVEPFTGWFGGLLEHRWLGELIKAPPPDVVQAHVESVGTKIVMIASRRRRCAATDRRGRGSDRGDPQGSSPTRRLHG